MKKKYLPGVIVLVFSVVFLLSILGLRFIQHGINSGPGDTGLNEIKIGDAKTNVNDIKTENDKMLSFVPLTKQVEPSFIKNIYTTQDIKVGFHYDGDYTPANDWGFLNSQFYEPELGGEKFLSVSKAKDTERYSFGPDNYLPLFQSQGSHSYQGTPIYILNENNKYTLSYLGFKINDESLISELTVELGVDYFADGYDKRTSNLEKKSFLNSLLGIETANACGPGIYLRKVGNSKLTPFKESDGIAWYKLDNPINLYDINKNYCDPEEETQCGQDVYNPCYCAKIDSLKNGNLRMHVYYKPNDKEGLLRIQMANFIVSDQTGAFSQVIMGDDFNHYYRAYLH